MFCLFCLVFFFFFFFFFFHFKCFLDFAFTDGGKGCTKVKSNYSRLSLSRPRLSRVTTYLEVKIWSLFKYENLTMGNKILWKRGEIAPKE